MSELREQIRGAIKDRFRAVKSDPNGEWDHWIDDTTDDVIAVIAAQPRPEMVLVPVAEMREWAFRLDENSSPFHALANGADCSDWLRSLRPKAGETDD